MTNSIGTTPAGGGDPHRSARTPATEAARIPTGSNAPAGSSPTGGNAPAGNGPPGNGPPDNGPPDNGPAGNGPAGNGRAGNRAGGSSGTRQSLTQDHHRIVLELDDTAVHHIFAASLGLSAALALIDDDHATGRVLHAIDELDRAIKDLREMAIILSAGDMEHTSNGPAVDITPSPG
jgi:hypothetical protein